jgi:hypothetical protein
MAPREPKVCIDRRLPPELLLEAAERAIEENPANVAVVHFRPGLGVAGLSPLELAAITGKKWANGRTLRVRFLDGDSGVQAKVAERAHRWSEFADITLSFGDAARAEIRISFLQRGSWSYIGTDALSIAADAPTMNYGWLTPSSRDSEYERVVVHEFGHALGCIHEHQNPAASIPWDKEAVYRYYMGPPNNWTKQQVDNNLFRTYDRTITQFSDFDRASIMLYPIPNAHTMGDYQVGWNGKLSETDKSFIGTMYPRAQKTVVDLDVNGDPAEAEIGKHGEEDLFRFAVEDEDAFTIETEGRTDVVVSVLGPDDETRIVAEDDDSGFGRNAKINATLAAGAYLVRVRHYRPTGTGSYRISVRR